MTVSEPLIDHTMNLVGSSKTLKLPHWIIKYIVCRKGKKITFIEWRGCMAHRRHIRSVGKIIGWKRFTNYSYKNELGLLVEYNGLRTWVHPDRLRFIGKFPYTIEEWV